MPVWLKATKWSSTVKDCRKSAKFFCEWVHGMQLKLGHSTMYQVQCQIAIKMYQGTWCDFFVWMKKDSEIQRIAYSCQKEMKCSTNWNIFMLIISVQSSFHQVWSEICHCLVKGFLCSNKEDLGLKPNKSFFWICCMFYYFSKNTIFRIWFQLVPFHGMKHLYMLYIICDTIWLIEVSWRSCTWWLSLGFNAPCCNFFFITS